MDTMTEIACVIGAVFMIGGAAVIAAVLVGLAWGLIGQIWIDASNRWRNICKAESLIHEYRRERENYLRWKEADNGGEYMDGNG